MISGTLKALLAVAAWLFLLCSIGHAETYVIGPTGWCTVISRGELDLGDKSAVICYYQGVDETGDGVPESVQMVIVLGSAGGVRCDLSHVNILDPTKSRGNLVRWYRTC